MDQLAKKYALETDPGAGCENMHSVKIILSPYSDKGAMREAPVEAGGVARAG